MIMSSLFLLLTSLGDIFSLDLGAGGNAFSFIFSLGVFGLIGILVIIGIVKMFKMPANITDVYLMTKQSKLNLIIIEFFLGLKTTK
uniref:Uncharacterized protein n=1 Tax=Euplotes harpa TaxID=151035 RepID=A0A7S3NC78_9SPIT